MSKYNISSGKYILTTTTQASINNRIDSPTAIFTRQRSFKDNFSVKVDPQNTQAGITVYQESDQHYDLIVKSISVNKYQIQVRLVIGPAISVFKTVEIEKQRLQRIGISCTSGDYLLYVVTEEGRINLGKYDSRFLSTEVASNFTGVMFGMFVEPQRENGKAMFSDLIKKSE